MIQKGCGQWHPPLCKILSSIGTLSSALGSAPDVITLDLETPRVDGLNFLGFGPAWVPLAGYDDNFRLDVDWSIWGILSRLLPSADARRAAPQNQLNTI